MIIWQSSAHEKYRKTGGDALSCRAGIRKLMLFINRRHF
jgi:hypothetical protein